MLYFVTIPYSFEACSRDQYFYASYCHLQKASLNLSVSLAVFSLLYNMYIRNILRFRGITRDYFILRNGYGRNI